MTSEISRRLNRLDWRIRHADDGVPLAIVYLWDFPKEVLAQYRLAQENDDIETRNRIIFEQTGQKVSTRVHPGYGVNLIVIEFDERPDGAQ